MPARPLSTLRLAPLNANAGEVTVEELARRLQALEQRLGATAATDATTGAEPTGSVADLDQRLRVLERKLELQAEEAAAKAAKDEDASYRRVVRPNQPFTIGAAGWGALELVARYGELDIDDDAFPLFANPASAASQADAWSVGVNWYLTQNLKLVANYTQTTFEGGAANGADREDEKTLFTRAQISF
ncbi:MAG TPA: porin [Lysobacter sp.]|jgi:hypothetical protein|nr:porin [Lysobacter sp.]